ncbi:MAG: MBL fold metallo-hydrolase, partial [Candidatus Methanomethylophilaceae archaeon]
FDDAMQELEGMGYLRRSLSEPVYLKFEVQLPQAEGALFDFLDGITSTRSNISFLDFDVTGGEPDALRVGIVLDDQCRAEELMDIVKKRYPMSILEYRTTGEGLDDAVFYVRFAQELRSLIPDVDDGFLLRFLSDINHIMQSLHRRGQDHREVFQSILDSGRYLHRTIGPEFFCDIQTMDLLEGVLLALQMPCGGNVYVLQRSEGVVLVDSGYGHYHADLMRCMEHLGIKAEDVDSILLTHADADHCGSAGHFPCPTHLSPGSLSVIQSSDRAHGSSREGSILESYYTRIINLLSGCRPPSDVRLFPSRSQGRRGGFDIMERRSICGWELEVLQGMDGHVPGQTFFYLPRSNVLFSSDSLMDFNSLSPERKQYMNLAKLLMTTVNVDSERAGAERRALQELASQTGCLVCGGHGSVFCARGMDEWPVPSVSLYRHEEGTDPVDVPGR